MQTFSDWLKAELRQRGLSYHEFGQLSGIPARVLSAILKGQRLPNARGLARIARGLDLPLEAVALQVRVPEGRRRPEPGCGLEKLLEQLDNPLLAAFLGWKLAPQDPAPPPRQPALPRRPGPHPKARARLIGWDARRMRRKW